MVQINADGMTKRKSLARRVLLYAIIAFITSALIAAVLIMIGLIPLKRNGTSLPCNDLASYQTTKQIYVESSAAIDKLKSVGKSVKVNIKHADCPSRMQNKGYVEITYGNDIERDKIMKILNDDGLGIYTVLVRQ